MRQAFRLSTGQPRRRTGLGRESVYDAGKVVHMCAVGHSTGG